MSSDTVRAETIRPGEARWGTDDHDHVWLEGNNVLGDRFAECLCGATAEWEVEVSDE